MASGYIVFSPWPSSQYAVPSNSCADVLVVAQSKASAPWVAISCTSDPVVAGTKVRHKNGTSYIDWTVNSITATATVIEPSPSPTPLGSIDLTPLIGTVIVIAYALTFFFGFHSGASHGSR